MACQNSGVAVEEHFLLRSVKNENPIERLSYKT